MMVLVLSMSAAVIIFLHTSFSSLLKREFKQKAVAITKSIATRSTNYILTQNLLRLKDLINEEKQLNRDILYLLILDENDIPLIHSFKIGIPPQLFDVHKNSYMEVPYQMQLLDTEKGFVYDIAVPILAHNELIGTVRSGFTLKFIEEAFRRIEFIFIVIAATIMLFGIFLAFALSNFISRPIRELARATELVAKGKLDTRISIKSKDEIGVLASSFNDMTSELNVLVRNMSAMNEVSRAISMAPNLSELLRSLAKRICSIVDASFCVLVVNTAAKDEYMAEFYGDLKNDMKKELLIDIAEGDMSKSILGPSEGIVIKNIAESRYKESGLSKKFAVNSLIGIPLFSKNNITGSIFVLNKIDKSFNEDDFKLLKEISPQISIIIENSLLHKKIRELTISETKSRLAMELHDRLAQSLTGIIYGIELCQKLIYIDVDRARSELNALLNNSKTILEKIRFVIFDLSEELTESLDIKFLLNEYIQRFKFKNKINVTLVSSGDFYGFDVSKKRELFYIVREALNNIVKHSGAKNAIVELNLKEDGLTLIIKDDGCGFELEEALFNAEEKKSFGLVSMKERARLLGGQLDITTARDKGTQINVFVSARETERI